MCVTDPRVHPSAPGTGVSSLNGPNALTVLRIVLVPVFVVIFFVDSAEDPWWRIAAFGVFAAAMATDWVDGYWARRKNLVTDFGKLADPIADKALVAAALISLSVVGDLFWWVTVVILVREIGITLWRFFGVDHVVAASPGGKLKTVTQSLGLGLLILPLPEFLWPLAWLVMGVAVALTVWTGIDYVLRARAAAKENRNG